MIYKATGNLRAIQILVGHTKIENTVRYLGVDIEDALELAEHTRFDNVRPRSGAKLLGKAFRIFAVLSSGYLPSLATLGTQSLVLY